MITVLRLGHRKERDKRITTHVGLVARAFGADEFILSGEEDSQVLESLEKVCKRWGGKMKLRYEKNWRKVIREFKGTKVHLTMYGIDYKQMKNKIKGDLLVIVGAEKVPHEVYDLVDYNVAVGNQPHSEVAALGLFLNEINPDAVYRKFEDAEIEIEPSNKGKHVKKLKHVKQKEI